MPKQIASEVPLRRRGRPSGKNRIPLSVEERRARNAQYERERRCKTSEAMAQLAEAAGYPISISNAELLAAVATQLQRAAKRSPEDDIENLRRCNENLMQQIEELEQRLGWSEIDEAEKENQYNKINLKPCKRRNLRSNIKHKQLNSEEDAKVPEQLFEMKLHSDDREPKHESSDEQWTTAAEGESIDKSIIESMMDFKAEPNEINQWPIEELINEYL